MTAARVEYLKKTYKKEFDTFWDPYVALCTKHQIDQIDLVSKLGSKEFIGLSDLESVVNQHAHQIEKEKEPNKRKRGFAMQLADAEKANARRQACSCGHRNFVDFGAKSCDNGTLILPSGKQIEGYMPTITGVSESDGVFMSMCAKCGKILGFDVQTFRREIARLEASEYIDEHGLEDTETADELVAELGLDAAANDDDDDDDE